MQLLGYVPGHYEAWGCVYVVVEGTFQAAGTAGANLLTLRADWLAKYGRAC